MDATINEKWPENVRLKMIERSELYEPKKVYQFGYYDGYQESQSEIQRLKELLESVVRRNAPLDILEEEVWQTFRKTNNL